MKSKNVGSATQPEFFAKFTALWPALKGSLVQVRRACIRPHCRACAKGEKHPAYLLAFTEQGRRRCLYVPVAMVPVLQRALANGRRIEELLYAMGPALLHEYRAGNPAQTGPAARITRSKAKKSPGKS